VDKKPSKEASVKIVVDTNIVFSTILNSNSTIGKILLGSGESFHFYSCDFLRKELISNRSKLIKLTKLSAQELDELELIVTSKITFINEGLIPEKIWSSTEKILTDVDINDTPFVALAKHLKARLWSGDKKLMAGLSQRNLKITVTTLELLELKEIQ
jgi:predicted nucleic acid-binding protein